MTGTGRSTRSRTAHNDEIKENKLWAEEIKEREREKKGLRFEPEMSIVPGIGLILKNNWLGFGKGFVSICRFYFFLLFSLDMV